MATLNRAHLIEESLDAIQNQTFKDWECIIVDDGSEDNTAGKIIPYLEDSRFSYLSRNEKHKNGLSGCRNYGLEKSNGDYIIFFDDDDLAHPENLSTCFKILDESEFDFCHYQKRSFINDFRKFDEVSSEISKYPIGRHQIEAVVTNKIALASCTVMWKSECFEKTKFLESLMYAEEWECYLRILLKGFSGVGIQETLYYNRKHSNSNTGEFWAGNSNRRSSKIVAVKLVINRLIKYQLLSRSLVRFFVQKGIFLRDISIIQYLFKVANISFLVKFKYYSLFYFYPIIGRMYRLKKYLTNG